MRDTDGATPPRHVFLPSDVLEFSSQYGSNRSGSYVVNNIVCDQPNVYPLYGDSTHALVFRTYGPWWMILPSYEDMVLQNFSRPEPDFRSRDYIDIRYPERVTNCLTLNIIETFNPGTLEVVYAGEEINDRTIRWHQVWKYPEPFKIVLKDNSIHSIENGRQQISDLFPNNVNQLSAEMTAMHINADRRTYPQIPTQHSYPAAARLPRVVQIPLENRFSFPTRHFRLEFDHKCVDYYTEIDTITLSVDATPVRADESQKHRSFFSKIGGWITGENSSQNKTQNPAPVPEESVVSSSTKITDLPIELLFQICSLLDLRSLTRFSSTCRYLHKICSDSSNFRSLNLQPYWYCIDDEAIRNYFQRRCQKTQYLSLAWTKSIHSTSFDRLLRPCGNNLIHLNLSSCQYLRNDHINIIVDCCPNIQILNLDSCITLRTDDFIPLSRLTQLRALNVYRTSIDDRTLLPLIDQNSHHLEHLNLGSCPVLGNAAGIVRLIFGSCSKLRSLDLWRGRLQPEAFMSILQPSNVSGEDQQRIEQTLDKDKFNLAKINFHDVSHMTQLAELDLGWTDAPAFFIKHLVEQAGRNLIKIFLTACRKLKNDDLLAISQHCPRLRQLDILNCNGISFETIEILLERCSDLEFIDLSYCSSVTGEHVSRWKSLYQCSFKRSYTPQDQQHVSMEFP